MLGVTFWTVHFFFNSIFPLLLHQRRKFNQSTEQGKGVGRVEVSAAVIEAQITKLLKGVGGILGRAKQSAGDIAGMELQEVELSVSINAAGEVSLLGIGGTQAGVEGAITLKFGKPD
jgi:hypothetical protein